MSSTKKPFAIYSAGHIVRVPFPFVERDEERVRPALIVSEGPLGLSGNLLWALMITSARGREPWPDDISVGPNHAQYGLPVPCLIRTSKISTLSRDAVERRLGKLPEALMAEVRGVLARRLGLSLCP